MQSPTTRARAVATACALVFVVAPSAEAGIVTFEGSNVLADYLPLGLGFQNARILSPARDFAIFDNVGVRVPAGTTAAVFSSNQGFFATPDAPIRIDFVNGASSVSFLNSVNNLPRPGDPDPAGLVNRVTFVAKAYDAGNSLVDQASLTTIALDRVATWTGTLSGEIAYVLFYNESGRSPFLTWNIGVGRLTFVEAPVPAAALLFVPGALVLASGVRRRRDGLRPQSEK